MTSRVSQGVVSFQNSVATSPAISHFEYDDSDLEAGGATPSSSAATSILNAPGSLRLRSSKTRAEANIPLDSSTIRDWFSIESIKADFQRHPLYTSSPEAATHSAPIAGEGENVSSDGSSSPSAYDQALFLANFARFLAERIREAKATCQAFDCELALLKSSWKRFHAEFLPGSANIHGFAHALEVESRSRLIRAYFETYTELGLHGPVEPELKQPKVLRDALTGEANIYAVFGGQGNNLAYFDELQTLYDTYFPLVYPLIDVAHERLMARAAALESNGVPDPRYKHGFNLRGWLSGQAERPPTAYLASIPVSGPLFGLTQLTQCFATCLSAGLTVAEARDRFRGCAGHSQGVISATVLSVATCNEDFVAQTGKAIDLYFTLGFLSTEPYSSADVVNGDPTPMLVVNGADRATLEKRVALCNKYLSKDRQVYLSLINGPTTIVLTGKPDSLEGVARDINSISAPAKLDQTKVPFSKRKPVYRTRFLPIGSPFHSPYLADAADKVEEFYPTLESQPWQAAEMKMPVYNSYDGTDLRNLPRGALVDSLCRQILTLPVEWLICTDFPAGATHVVDFGTGGLSGIGGLTARNLDGRGIRPLIVSGNHERSVDFYSVDTSHTEEDWGKAFSPKLVKTKSGKLLLDTPMSRLLGRPPIMVGGMTPCTVNARINAAVLNAGYHIELAGGGIYNERALRDRVSEIQSMTSPGHALTLNALYINQKQWGFQLPAWQKMRKEGLPVEGFCIAAGVPVPQKAEEIIRDLKNAGIKHVSFKPGSLPAIQQVCKIASQNPDFPIILQWTGGRAGGHHSAEDFHQPILASYGLIRKNPNIILVAGSGFGSAKDFWPYFSGDWSLEFGRQPMPFDGVLFASRIMTAAEALTSLPVKELIASTPGCQDHEWEGTYEKPTGGIITLNSEMNEPVHQIANRGALLWAELDKELFSLPKDKQQAYLQKNKGRIIQRLNSDFQKVWFAQNKEGQALDDVAEMTYEEVCDRLLALMFVGHQSRWIDRSLRNLFGDWCRRVEERFLSNVTGGSSEKPYKLQSYAELDVEPRSVLEKLLGVYQEARSTLLTGEDVAYFHSICWRVGQKPAPFITRLGDDFVTQFKKDSLWQAEDLDAVVGRDAQRVCILHGPVAARNISKVNEPVAQILGGTQSELIAKVLDRFYEGDLGQVPEVEYLERTSCSPIASRSEASHVSISESGNIVKVYKPSKRLPALRDWLETIAGARTSWLRALVCSATVVRGRSIIANPISNLLAPRKYQTVEAVFSPSGEPLSLTAYGGARSFGRHEDSFKSVEIIKDLDSSSIDVVVFEERLGESIPLKLRFTYHPDESMAPIREVGEGRNDQIKQFFWKVWFGVDMPPASQLAEVKEFSSGLKPLEDKAITKFCDVLGTVSTDGKAPMDFAITAGWEAIMQAAITSCDADLLCLVHLSNSFRRIDENSRPLTAGDVCTATARVKSVKITETGKAVSVEGTVLRLEDGELQPVIAVTSDFFYRGKYNDYEKCFQSSDDKFSVEIAEKADVAILMSKEWFEWTSSSHELTEGSRLVVDIHSETRMKDDKSFSAVEVKGKAVLEGSDGERALVAEISYSAESVSVGNPVLDYLKRFGQDLSDDKKELPTPYEISASGSRFRAPPTNEDYSKASGDFNPIHINPYFASLANLPGTITHGLFSSAATRRITENIAAGGSSDRFVSFSAKFVGMVLPGDDLQVKLTHFAMRNGNKLIKVETLNQRGEKVVEAEAEVKQPSTVYVFTGQGSQEKGMGMDLYGQSKVAKAIWDEADSHLYSSLGLSIIEIVRENPQSKTVYFGGEAGRRIRETYMAMSYDSVDAASGKRVKRSLFPDISETTRSYTFQSPKGLLFATQFAQVALVLFELSAFRDLQERGLIVKDAVFAGHSLGEYAALASVAGMMRLKDLVDVVFYRGMTMQKAVPRKNGRSSYGMVAVAPAKAFPKKSSISPDSALAKVVDLLCQESGELLQIVNYNVAEQQSVVAGHELALLAMSNVLAAIGSLDLASAEALVLIRKHVAGAKLAAQAGPIELERGNATIPLAGIDVPFHSRFLTGGVEPFRAFLQQKLDASLVRPHELVGRYIPNLTASLFSLDRSYVDMIFKQTKSPILEGVLAEWGSWSSAAKSQDLARIVVIELLSYQFASPVRWIETQDIIFGDVQVSRLVEFGVSPTLIGMAKRTLAGKYAQHDKVLGVQREMLCSNKDHNELSYSKPEQATQEKASPPSDKAPAAPVPAPVQAPVASAPAPIAKADIPDAPLDALFTIRAVLGQKLKLGTHEIVGSKTIKTMTGGRSTLQNEIVGDLQAEFGDLPDRSEELTVDELALALNPGYSGTLGKYTTGLVARLVTGKMPGGFGLSNIKAHVKKAFGLGAGRTDGVLLEAVTREPAQRLSNEAAAIEWLQTVTNAYAAIAGINLSQAGDDSGAGGAAAVGSVVNSEELNLLKSEQYLHAKRQVKLLEDFIGHDSDDARRATENVKTHLLQAQQQLDDIASEHGDRYVGGIQPKFSQLKARHFTSYWNWSRQNVALLFSDILDGKLTKEDPSLAARCVVVINQLNDLSPIQHELKRASASKAPGRDLAIEVCQALLQSTCEGPSRYRDVSIPAGPKTVLDNRGNIKYSEVPRPGVHDMEDYVYSMASAGHFHAAIEPSELEAKNGLLRKLNASQTLDSKEIVESKLKFAEFPWLYAMKQNGLTWVKDEDMTKTYYEGLFSIVREGVSFEGLTVLLTGVGEGSIGFEMIRSLLAGGARVIITTSSFSSKKVNVYQKLYRECGGRGSSLTVVPFNQASKKDVDALIGYIYETLQTDIDALIPFAAIPENGRYIDNIDDQSELAHRIMLTNVFRLMGSIKTQKAARKFHHRPTQVLLPLSFNHGVIGGDGLYGASKIGLETLLNSFETEDWKEYLFITGARIGICRGTDLMASQDMIAERMEALNLRTFSTREMATNLVALLDPRFVSKNQLSSVMMEFSGASARCKGFGYYMSSIRQEIQKESQIKRSLISENATDFKATKGAAAEDLHQKALAVPRGLSQFKYPTLGSLEDNRAIAKMDGSVDLDRVIVITGFAEVGPWGSSRTRWEMEADGVFSTEGLIEMAWVTGLIKHFNGKLKSNGQAYVGWVDAKSGEPVHDSAIRARYEKQILDHSGIRLVEPENLRGFDPNRKGYQQEIELNHDMEPLEVSASEAAKYKLQHGDHVTTFEDPESGSWQVTLKKGARIFVPKAAPFDRKVAGQLPTGWAATRYGIPEDIVAQTDETALYALICVAEALINAGITDPYELYKHVHISEVGNSLGSGMGGLNSLSKMFLERRNDQEVQKDILQETFVNTVAGWVNLLLLSSCGPIKPTVAACATAIESIDVAAETILAGKAKVMVAGALEGLTEQSMFEFANMKATASSDVAFEKGLEASELSKPMTSGRSGFVESQGCGVQIIMTAATALKIGAPINGILAYSRTASDRQGRSVPAPGQGVLSTAVPLKRALTSWGMSADDIGVISMHGTSTKANDKNESDVYQKLFQRMGRTPGNSVPSMAQKWLCGHAKGGAAAWAMNGVMQSIESLKVAGNRNADDIAPELEKFDYLMYPCTTITRTRQDLNAGLVTSFGFGQVGGIVLILHAGHLLGRIGADQFQEYAEKRKQRQAKTFRRMQSMFTNGDLVQIKDSAPYPDSLASEVMLDLEVRAEKIGDTFGYKLPLQYEREDEEA
ncbi:fatty acid synthase [Violaceomyces palustris]|uniref:Fatty acid synthase n=1 Tax=Violaceomyces palustris TaxID=1673888 RepID=A0ACD0NUS5_9BASI|nr:fatty acid synthase [Violaceomyces palustris]